MMVVLVVVVVPAVALVPFFDDDKGVNSPIKNSFVNMNYYCGSCGYYWIAAGADEIVVVVGMMYW